MDMKRTVIPRLHDTGMNFRAGMKISLRHKNRGELAPVWLAPAWHFVLVSCKRIQSHKREPEWTRAGMKVAPISCKHPLTFIFDLNYFLCELETSKRQGVNFLLETKHKVFRFKTKPIPRMSVQDATNGLKILVANAQLSVASETIWLQFWAGPPKILGVFRVFLSRHLETLNANPSVPNTLKIIVLLSLNK